MAERAHGFLEAEAHPRLSALGADPRPALLFDRTGTALLWANGAGAAYLGAASVDRLTRSGFAPDSLGARRIAALARQLAGADERTERLALPKGLLPQPVVCRAARVILAGERCVLLTVVDGTGRLSPADAASRHAALLASAPVPAAPAAGPLPARAPTPAAGPLPVALDDAEDPYAVAQPAAADAEDPAAPAVAALTDPMDALDGDGIVPSAMPEAAVSAPDAAGPAADTQAMADAPSSTETVAKAEAEAEPAPSAEAPVEDGPTDDAVATEPTPPAPPMPRFIPPSHGRMVRFVFELDGALAFSFLSDELASAVGPLGAAVAGETWPDAAGRLGLDPLGRVGRALDGRETFTGLTVDWPVQDADLRVPVDLAGMPVFGRDRSFRGYRGFGIAKTGAYFPAPMLLTIGAPEAADDLGMDAAPALVGESEPEVVTAPAPPVDDAPAVDLGSEWAETGLKDDLSAEDADIAPTPSEERVTEAPLAATALEVGPAGSADAAAPEPAPASPVSSLKAIAAAAFEGATVRPIGSAPARSPRTPAEPSSPERPPQPPEVEPVPPDAPPAAPETPDAPPSPARPVTPEPDYPAPGVPEPDTPLPVEEPAPLPEEAPAGSPAEAPVEIPDEGPGPLPAEEPAGMPAEVPGPGSMPSAFAARSDAAVPDATVGTVAVEADRLAAVVADQARLAAEAARDEAGEEADEPTPPAASQSVVIQSPIIARPVPKVVLSEEDLDRRQLSRPEREAFQKIAEALGARLEGGAPAAKNRAADKAPAASPRTAAPETPADEEPVVDKRQGRFDFGPEPAALRGAAEPGLDRASLDRLPIALVILKDGEALFVNRAFLDLTGYETMPAFEAAGGFAAAFAGSALPRDASLPAVRRRDGVEIPVSAKVHSIGWGDSVASLLILQDTAGATGRERAADAEQRVEELEAILDTATDGVLVIDDIGVVLAANRSAEALFGMERSHMVGAALVSLLAPESHRDALDYIDGLSRNGLSSVLNDGREVIARVKGGGLVPLFMTAGRVSPQKFCAVLRDITQWKRAEEELTNAKRAAETASSQKSEFLAKISHEIRTPLNAIIGFSEVMMEERFGPVGSDRYKEYLRDIHISGAHIMSLVNDLLDLSKIEAGKLDLSFEAVAANEVIRECVALMQPQANRERVIIRTSLSSSLPAVVADSRSLRQIVLNLLSNAIKFNTPGGQVIVSTLYEETGEVAVRVRDTGPGMSEEDIAKALEPFRQLQTARPGRGTGLGLPLTKALVEANRAIFRIDSTVGQGTLVQVTFPSTRVLAE